MESVHLAKADSHVGFYALFILCLTANLLQTELEFEDGLHYNKKRKIDFLNPFYRFPSTCQNPPLLKLLISFEMNLYCYWAFENIHLRTIIFLILIYLS
jgi:hypothetical protein